MIVLWPFLLPAAAFSGWWVAYHQKTKKESLQSQHLSREYVLGLNYLLNEQDDKAVDIFIKILEVDNDTVETHLALGCLFRRRGEVDRAIRIHQNVIARPQLNIAQRKEALFALGQDYLSAGLFDRAEKVFLEVVELGGEQEKQSLHGLLTIYQQEKAWEKALAVVKRLDLVLGQKNNIVAAHYFCEMAELLIKQQQYEKAYQAIRQALAFDAKSVRANLIFSQMEIHHQRYKNAIKALRQITKNDPDFTPEVIELLVLAYQKSDGRMSVLIFYMI